MAVGVVKISRINLKGQVIVLEAIWGLVGDAWLLISFGVLFFSVLHSSYLSSRFPSSCLS